MPVFNPLPPQFVNSNSILSMNFIPCYRVVSPNIDPAVANQLQKMIKIIDKISYLPNSP